MAKVNLVDKQARMGLGDIVRFQLLTHCFINKITVSDLDLECLTILGLHIEPPELSDFCDYMAKLRHAERMKTWKPDTTKPHQNPPEPSSQSIRNILIRAEKAGLIVKEEKYPRKVYLNPDIKIQTKGNILFNCKFLYAAAEENKGDS